MEHNLRFHHWRCSEMIQAEIWIQPANCTSDQPPMA